jgi:hypothetical protein
MNIAMMVLVFGVWGLGSAWLDGSSMGCNGMETGLTSFQVLAVITNKGLEIL